ncbi:MAG: hypothetical protein CYG60_16750 [Actinobacteria bacterium]|nr:MAG: hypothetical protein CYG60_16750 [Actinomycetota bacterium]
MPGMPRAVLYARVSTEEQNNGFSISDQLRTLHDHGGARGSRSSRSAWTPATPPSPRFRR